MVLAEVGLGVGMMDLYPLGLDVTRARFWTGWNTSWGVPLPYLTIEGLIGPRWRGTILTPAIIPPPGELR